LIFLVKEGSDECLQEKLISDNVFDVLKGNSNPKNKKD
jgi:hypothetical protein